MVSWYGEITATFHQKCHMFDYLYCGRFVFSDDCENFFRFLRPGENNKDGRIGLSVLGPSLHYWFSFLSRHFPKQDSITTFKKMAMGQIIFGPTMMLAFFSLNAFLQGESCSDILARLRRDFPRAMLNCVMYWSICDFITFKFSPVHLQPLVSNLFSYVWTMYMTYMGNRKKPDSISS